MNRCFRVLWSNARQAYVVAPEKAGIAKVGMSAGMSQGMRRTVTRPGLAAGTSAACVALLLGANALASSAMADTTLPTGAQITHGNASISQGNNALVVDQATQHLITHWQSFNIGADASVTFNQPGSNAVALNRVLGQDPSQILGALNANGQVFLVNPNGVVFGQNAQVNTGALVASSLGISDQQFLDGTASGSYRFGGQHAVAAPGDILNHGALTGSVVALMAPVVRNTGTITGDAALAGGTDVTLDFNGDGLLGLTVNASALATLVDNQGIIQADGGHVILTARGASQALTGVVNHSGTIQARTLEEKNGRILLLGDMDHGQANVSGLLDASAPQSGDGGFIETSAARVRFGEDFAVTTAAPAGKTGQWLIDPYDFTIADTGGDITGAQLSTALTTNDVTIETVVGGVDCVPGICGNGAPGKGDIFVNADVTWSTNTLTLSAYRNIEINAVMTATGGATLALEYDQGGQGGDYFVGDVMDSSNTGRVDLASQSNTFTTKRGSGGNIIAYTIITSLGDESSTTGLDLQGIRGNLSGNYVLGANINAGVTATWSGGFAPIGGEAAGTRFTGRFDGLGHTITGLTINRPSTDYVGLFGVIDDGAPLRNVGLVDAVITGNGYVGGLLGRNNNSAISNVYVTGTVQGRDHVGGLAGANDFEGTISNAYATADVTGLEDLVGGLVGSNWESFIDNAYATGAVIGRNDVGGLVGASKANSTWAGSRITNAYATGSVEGVNLIGGLVGYNRTGSLIENAYATGDVEGVNLIGGLVGYNRTGSLIENAYATGDVEGISEAGRYVGGLVGANEANSIITLAYATGAVTNKGEYTGGLLGINNDGPVSQVYATGTVQGDDRFVGGLVGSNDDNGEITNAYATGDVIGASSDVGGLVGSNWGGFIENAYAANNVTGDSVVGRLVGFNGNGGAVSNSFWDSGSAGVTVGIGDGGHGQGATGKTSAQMQSLATFNDVDNTAGLASAWDIDDQGGTGMIWRIYEGQSTPLLRGLLTGLTVSANGTVVYNGQLPDTPLELTYSLAAVDTDLIGDSDANISVLNLEPNVGNYATTVSNVYSSHGGYDISFVEGLLSITPRPIDLVAERTYNGETSLATGTFTLNNLVAGENLVLNGAGNMLDRHAGSDKEVLPGDLVLANGADGLASNYTLVDGTHRATITPAAISIGTEAVTKVEDGTTDADGIAMVISGTLFGPDSLSGGSFAFIDPSPGTGKTVTVSAVSIDDGNLGNNYSITFVPNTNSTILAAEQPPRPAPVAPTPVPASAPQQINATAPRAQAGVLTIALAPLPAESLGLIGGARISDHDVLLQALTLALPGWAITFDRETLSISIDGLGFLFERESADLQPGHRTMLDDFVPRLVDFLMHHRDQIQALAIQGHASSEWRGAGSAEEAHALNLALSQTRAQEVHDAIQSLIQENPEHAWIADRLTSEGKAASRPLLDSQGREDAVGSRRVNFQVLPGNRQGE